MLWMFGLGNSTLTEIIKHDRKIHDMGHKFIHMESGININFKKNSDKTIF
jgi:hypothetical protein